jgi:hypothetical protein
VESARVVDTAQYSAARAYQRLYETATIANVSTADLLRPKVDGGRIPNPISPNRIAATKRSIEGTVKDWHGHAGLSLTSAVLTGGKSVEKSAREFGANSTREGVELVGYSGSASIPSPRRSVLPTPRRGRGGCGSIAMVVPIWKDGDLGDPGLRRGPSALPFTWASYSARLRVTAFTVSPTGIRQFCLGHTCDVSAREAPSRVSAEPSHSAPARGGERSSNCVLPFCYPTR